jgi:site-specific DNA-methyltransferase (adenine-specific)
MEINKIYNENCLDTMARMPDNFLDLTVTSPPYDNLRDYKGYTFDFESIAKELYRVTKEGGVVVWVVGDSYDKNGSETLNSFKQALFLKEIGFNVHDTMIYQKNSYPFPPVNRYYQQFEYMFVFSKGKPKTYNIQRCETDPRWRNKTNKSSSQRNSDGTTHKLQYETGKDTRKMDNVWKLNTGYMKGTSDKIAFKHPATFPDLLAERHILSWSNEGDLVYDPFMGSGTTAKMAILNKRNYIGSEIAEEYVKIAEERVSKVI